MDEEHKRHKKEDPDLSDAMSYLTHVKNEYKDDPSVYDHFLELMRDYKQGKNDAGTIVRAVEQLFKGKKYLVDGFANFLPRTVRDDRIHDRFMDRNPERFNDRMERINDSRFSDMRMNERERGGDRLNDMRMNERLIHDRYAHDRIGDRLIPMERSTNDRGVDRGIIPNERIVNNERSINGNGERVVDRAIISERQSSDRIPEKIVDRSQFESRFFRNPRPEDLGAQKKALGFIHKVKRRFADGSDTYREFIRYLQQYQKMPGNADLVLNQLRGLLTGHEDLLSEFTDFLPQMKSRENSEVSRDIHVKEKREESLLIRTIHEVLKKKEILEPFTKLLNMYNQGCVSGKEFIILIDPILKNDDLLKAFKNFINYREIDAPPHILRNLRTYKKIFSYRILPENYREASCQGQEGIAKAVLNTFCMACPERDGTFLSSRKNQSEEILFKVEDERFECELQIMRVSDLITNMEYLASLLIKKDVSEEVKEEESVFFTLEDIDMPGGIVQEILTEIYREKAVDILEGILNHPQVSIPIVLRRLYSVLRRYKRDMKAKIRIWRETTIKNHYRAIDAQGFVFRDEKKDIISRNGLQENIALELKDIDVMNDVDDFYHAYISGLAENDAVDLIEWALNVIKTERDVCFFTTPQIAGVFGALIVLYTRLEEMKKYFLLEGSKEEIKAVKNDENLSNEKDVKPQDDAVGKIPISEQLDLLSEEEILRRDTSCRTYSFMINLIKDSLMGIIDTTTYEDRLRIITDIHGYKLFTIEKYFGKLEKMALNARNDESSMNTVKLYSKNVGKFATEAVTDSDVLYLVSKENGLFSIGEQEVEEDEKKEFIKDLVRLTINEKTVGTEKVCLERSKRNELNEMYVDFSLECDFREEKLRFVENTWDFLAKRGKKRTYESK